jgi:DNA-binding transcriptional MerR regulator
MAIMLQQLDLFEVPIDEAVVVFKKKKAPPIYPADNQEDVYEAKTGINQPGLFDNIVSEPEVAFIAETNQPEIAAIIEEKIPEESIELPEIVEVPQVVETTSSIATPETMLVAPVMEDPATISDVISQPAAETVIPITEVLQEEHKEPIIYANEQIVVKIKPKPKAATPKKEASIADQPKTEQKRGRKSYKEIDASVDLVDVPEDEILNQKLYCTISEVAGWFKVNTSLIRYWENEFDILQPRKTRKGDRLFRVEDIKNLQLIYFLLRQRKFSIEGAKFYLKNNRKNLTIETQLIKSLTGFRSFLKELKEVF